MLTTAMQTSLDLFGTSPVTFPVSVRIAPMPDPNEPRFAALTAAGLLNQGPQTTTLDMFRNRQVSAEFALTDKGRALWKPPNALGPGSPAGFCAGHLHIDEVASFTDPVVQGGSKISMVNLTMHTDYDSWTTAPDIQKAFRSELNQASPTPASMPMVLMNDGWTVATAPVQAPGSNPFPD